MKLSADKLYQEYVEDVIARNNFAIDLENSLIDLQISDFNSASQTAKNARHGAKGFVGYFPDFPQQIAHRATHGETGRKKPR